MKILPYILTAFVILCWVAAGWMWWESIQPTRGANMVLMAMPMIAGPALVASAAALWIYSEQRSKSKTEKATIGFNLISILTGTVLVAAFGFIFG